VRRGGGLQPLAVEFREAADDPVIGFVGEQQDFDAFFPECFQVGASRGGGGGGSQQVADLFLAFFHPGGVAAQWGILPGVG
jgi:hypothetical protein